MDMGTTVRKMRLSQPNWIRQNQKTAKQNKILVGTKQVSYVLIFFLISHPHICSYDLDI